MANPINYLIGRGETLVRPVEIASGGGEKAHPYSFDEALARLSPEIQRLSSAVAELPPLACPNDEAVISLTLHPAYLAKSYHPSRLFSSLGLRQVGSRERRVFPSKWTQKKAPDEALVAPELFVAGQRRQLEALGRSILSVRDEGLRDDFRRIEHIAPLGGERLHAIGGAEPAPPLEVVLHADAGKHWGQDVLRGFVKWCGTLGVHVDFSHLQNIGGLSFVGFHAARSILPQLAQFAFLRAVRRMPRLAFRDAPQSFASKTTFQVSLPEHAPVDPATRVAIFDGGLPEDHPFPSFVSALDAPGVSAPVPAALRHGVSVTSALLYGTLSNDTVPPQPFASVDHWRVLDEDGDDFELMTTLNRVMEVLQQQRYDFVSLSLGPDEAMLDDDVHVWTSRLDQFASSGQTLVVAAAGNNGDLDAASGLCRIQPAADGVNVLAVGAADRAGTGWRRAPYSAQGPGRSPGLVKPDVLTFGGSDQEPFYVVDEGDKARPDFGTSFAAPAAARLATGLRALFGPQLSPMAVKALLIHHANRGDHAQSDVGWGLLPSDLGDLSTCMPGEATIVYQGMLEPARYRRFLLPVPADGFSGTVELRATFVTATGVDPEDAINYTRTGVGITFRPKTVGHPGFYQHNGEWRERSAHQSKTFFGQSALFDTEQKLREDAHRWEAVLKASHRYRPASLDQPVFDIEHLARANGQAAPRADAVSYALILTVYEKGAPDLYNRIVRNYAGRLSAMRPQIDIPIRARS